jgi:uncharacterized RDD family membrane protein YckC
MTHQLHPGVRDDVITGEAVLVDVWPASFVTRALALVLDVLVQVLVSSAIAILLFNTLGSDSIDDAATAAVSLVTLIAVLVGLPVMVETFSRGRSLGKLAAGLRVVRDDGGPIRARHALIRGLLAVIELYSSLGSIAMITSLANTRGKRLGDALAGTYVIRERAPRPAPSGARMPPALAGWAAGADLGRIPDALALASRQLLTRSTPLTPQARQRLAQELAAALAPLVAPPPPHGTGPEMFLAAVMAERSRREYAKLSADANWRRYREDQRRRAPLGAGGTGLVERSG